MTHVRGRALVLAWAVVIGASGCRSDSATGPSAPVQLLYRSDSAIGPTQAISGRVINSGRVDVFGNFPAAVRVAIADASGRTVTSATDMVTIALAAGSPGGATLSGTLTVPAIQGLATFSDLSIGQTGTGYRLIATSGTLTSSTSDAFDVAVPMPAATQVAAGGIWACALTSAGSYCWGHDGGGELGINDSISRATPYPVLTGGATYSQVTAGYNETCAVTAAGAAYCWGHNRYGGAGDGTSGMKRFVPTPVSGSHVFTKLSDGYETGCGVTLSGAIYCWGHNDAGQIGNGTTNDATVPDSVHAPATFASVSAGWSYACALSTLGAPSCWGSNTRGNLGDGTLTDRSTPVSVTGGPYVFSAITTGDHQTCALRASDGAAFCWGSNSNGQLGDGTMTDRRAPVAVSGGKFFSAITAGSTHTCGIEKTTRLAYCWGWNMYGQLGDGTTTDRSTPTAVSGGHAFVSLSGGDIQTCGVASTGTVYCWGNNSEGGLGNGTSNPSNTPAAVTP